MECKNPLLTKSEYKDIIDILRREYESRYTDPAWGTFKLRPYDDLLISLNRQGYCPIFYLDDFKRIKRKQYKNVQLVLNQDPRQGKPMLNIYRNCYRGSCGLCRKCIMRKI